MFSVTSQKFAKEVKKTTEPVPEPVLVPDENFKAAKKLVPVIADFFSYFIKRNVSRLISNIKKQNKKATENIIN